MNIDGNAIAERSYQSRVAREEADYDAALPRAREEARLKTCDEMWWRDALAVYEMPDDLRNNLARALSLVRIDKRRACHVLFDVVSEFEELEAQRIVEEEPIA